jgi:LemA protein
MSSEVATTPKPRGRGLIILLVVVGLAVLAAIWFVSTSNRLIALQENVDTAWAQVEAALQRRFDLIPNLVATVKGYAQHEKEILEEVTRLRSQWGQARTPDEKARVGSELESALGRLIVVSENYPMLKADQGFRDLQVQLEGTENRVSVERQRYNDVVRVYNTAVRQFPGSLVANLRGFTTNRPYFEANPRAKDAPVVDFSPQEKSAG